MQDYTTFTLMGPPRSVPLLVRLRVLFGGSTVMVIPVATVIGHSVYWYIRLTGK